MSKFDTLLPEGFAALEPFVAQWAVGSLTERTARRDASNAGERQAFYDAAKDLVAPALDYLDTRPYAALAGTDQRLLWLMLGYAHVALAVELQGEDEDRLATYRPFMVITNAPWEQAERA